MKKQLTTLLFSLLPLFMWAYTGAVIRSFDTPAGYPSGLTWDGNHLWIGDFGTDKLYQLDTNGKVVHTIESPAYWPTGLTFDGKYLWNADTKGQIPQGDEYHMGKIFKIDPEDGTILSAIPAPTPSPAGLAWDGTYLWCTDDLHRKLIQFDPEDGTTIKEYPSPAGNPQGITFDGKYLWISDRGTNEIYMVDPSDGTVILIADAPGAYARGMAFDGQNLWNVDFESKKIYKLKAYDDELFIRKDSSQQHISFQFVATNFGPGTIKRVDAHIALPENRPGQKLTSKFSYSPAATETASDGYGQKTAHFVFKNVPSGEKREASVDYDITTYTVRYFIYPDKVSGAEDIPGDIKKLYLQDNAKYEIHDPVITDAVAKAVGNETNLYRKMRKIFNYVIKNMYYERVGGWNTAPTVLARGNGSCSEYSFVFISMCRSAGIPARYVGTIAKRGDNRALDDVFHRWVEVYLPPYGWIPVDPSGGDQPSPRGQAAHIGYVSKNYVITTQSAGGSETMGWNYNINTSYVTEPKTNVAIDYFGEWIQK